MPFNGEPIQNPQNVSRIITDAGGQVVGFTRNWANEPEVAEVLARNGSPSEVERATEKARDAIKNGRKPADYKPPTTDENFKKAKTNSRGFIPNFAPKLDPKQLKDAVDAERVQAPPGAIPTLGFNKGNLNQPFIYDARTQTEESAIRDHGGYKKG